MAKNTSKKSDKFSMFEAERFREELAARTSTPEGLAEAARFSRTPAPYIQILATSGLVPDAETYLRLSLWLTTGWPEAPFCRPDPLDGVAAMMRRRHRPSDRGGSGPGRPPVITAAKRKRLDSMLKSGRSKASIARALGVSVPTVYREAARGKNTGRE